jgi:flagellin-like protein
MRDNISDSGVSPVIGVVLMVAITVIMAAIIGNYGLSFTEMLSPSAQAGVTYDQTPNESNPDNWDVTFTYTTEVNADSVRIEKSGSFTKTPVLNNSGSSATFYNQPPGESIQVIGVKDGDRTVLYTVEVGD